MEPPDAPPPEPRSHDEIFADLRTLAQRPGALHEISKLVYRDWVITIDMKEGRITDDPSSRWSSAKLNKNELLLLLGLTVQCERDDTYSVLSDVEDFAVRADLLLREFHDRVLRDCAPAFCKDTQQFIERPEGIGLIAREAIYYGADSFYFHQLSRFSRLRYREDATWLLQNAGLSIRPMVDIAMFIAKRINQNMTEVGFLRKQGREMHSGDLTNSLLISKSDLRDKFGQKADAFLAKFSTPASGSNKGFVNPFAVNVVAIAPLIDIGEYLYVPNQYRLSEALYESPFYWMLADKSYCDVAAQHRGAYLEQAAAHVFTKVFGEANVHENVMIREGSKKIAGEVDVLVVYGEFVLIVQAKSKRITQAARAGNAEALKNDFESAISEPYRQAMECLRLICSGAECVTKQGKLLNFKYPPRPFPVVILSDSFPASTFLSGVMLESGGAIAPVIWDLGVLDAVARILPTPIELIFYLKSRAEVFEKVYSDSEYNFLGYHIKAKLAISDDFDRVMLDRDFATVVDDYMIAADVGIEAQRPLGILERLKIPIVSELLAQLKNADPQLASVVVDLYDFSSAALEDLSAGIISLRKEIVRTRKAIKALSIPTRTGGLTYAVALERDAITREAARAIGAKHKYDTCSDRWYVILDCVKTNNVIDGLLPLVWQWKENDAEAKQSSEVSLLFKSSKQLRVVGQASKTGSNS